MSTTPRVSASDIENDGPEVLARLSTNVTVEEGPAGFIQIVREASDWPSGLDAIITLRRGAEDRLLALLLARKGITLAPAASDAAESR